MHRHVDIRRITGRLLLCVVGFGAVGQAIAAEDQSLLVTPLSQAPGRQLTALKVSYAPGQSSPPHHHGVDAYAYVLSGHIRSQLGGGPVKVYGPGESWFEPAGTHHLISGNASTEQPASMLVILVGSPQAVVTTWDPPQPATPSRTQSR